jgi:hydrophobic/amphiphilic exporter-1 (mainly G- bacteria), HAE1 family
VVVKKVSSAFLQAISLVSTDNRYDSLFLTNYAQINLVNQIGNLEGVGESRLGTNQVYSMRVWVNPDKMAKLGVTATDVSSAHPGAEPAESGRRFRTAAGLARDGFSVFGERARPPDDPRQFEDIVLRAQPDASLLRLGDIGHVQLGAQTYTGFNRVDGRAAGNVIVYLSPGANAVRTAARVRRYLDQIKPGFPAGMDYIISYDSTMFVNAAIQDVMTTLFEAIGLVILVVFLFLQSWRATLIPLLTVPVALVGTLALFPLLGFSINITSMFGLVLSIGIVVDDAIVVVEAVQRHIDEGMPPREATIQAMKEVQAPVVAIAFILAAVFIPVAFLGGISGQIYRQFALTIAASVLLSAFNALSLSPALSAMILRPKGEARGPLTGFFGAFNRGFGWVTGRYLGGVSSLIRRPALALVGLFCFWLAAGAIFHGMPAGFLPDEDQGAVFIAIRLPDSSSVPSAPTRPHAGSKKLSAQSRCRRYSDTRRPGHRDAHQQFERRHHHCASDALGRASCEESATAGDSREHAKRVR